MAATLEFPIGIHSLTATASLFADASDTTVAACSAASLTEATNRTGMYTVSVTGLSGLYFAIAQVSGTDIAIGWVMMTTSGTCTVCESRSAALALPNAACTTNASLLTSGSGTDQVLVASGKVVTPDTQKVDLNTIKTQTVTCAGGVTVPAATLASTTNITGGTITTVTTVTNQLTAAQIATGIWQDATSGDFTVTSSIGKSLYTSGNAPGAASGIALVGSNMGSVSSVTAGVTVTTNNDKTGYSLSVSPPTTSAITTAMWQDLLSSTDFTTVGSIGALLKAGTMTASQLATIPTTGTVNTTTPPTVAAISTGIWTDTTASDFTTALSVGKSLMNGVSLGTGLTVAAATNLTNLPAVPTDWLTAAGVKADAVTKIQSGLATSVNVTAVITHGDTAWVTATGFYTGGDIAGNLLGNVTGTVGGVVGFNTALIDTTISSRLASTSYTAPPSASTVATSVWAFVIGSTSTGTMLTAIWTWITSAASNIRAAIGMSAANLDTQVAAIPVAVRDVNNLSPAANSLGAAVNVAGGGTVVIQNNIVVPPQVAQDSQIPARITCKRGDTTSRTLTLGTIAGWQKVLFTAKRSAIDADSAAIFQVGALSGGGGGLLIWNGEPATDASQASLTVSDATTGTVTLLLSALVTSGLSTGDLYWDCEVIYAANVVSTPQEGVFSTKLDITQAIS